MITRHIKLSMRVLVLVFFIFYESNCYSQSCTSFADFMYENTGGCWTENNNDIIIAIKDPQNLLYSIYDIPDSCRSGNVIIYINQAQKQDHERFYIHNLLKIDTIKNEAKLTFKCNECSNFILEFLMNKKTDGSFTIEPLMSSKLITCEQHKGKSEFKKGKRATLKIMKK